MTDIHPEEHDFTHSRQLPAHWFEESPEYAAELYALERWNRDVLAGKTIQEEIHVAASDNKLYVFKVNLYPDVHCRATMTIKVNDDK